MITNKQRDTITALRQREICLCATTIDAKSKVLTELQHKRCMLSHERYSIHVNPASVTGRSFGPFYRSYLPIFGAKYSIWCQQAPIYNVRSYVIGRPVCTFHSILTINQWKRTFQKWTNDQSAERKYVCHCCVAQVSSLVLTFDFLSVFTVGSSRQCGKCRIGQ